MSTTIQSNDEAFATAQAALKDFEGFYAQSIQKLDVADTELTTKGWHGAGAFTVRRTVESCEALLKKIESILAWEQVALGQAHDLLHETDAALFKDPVLEGTGIAGGRE
jgi:hypothetical protein